MSVLDASVVVDALVRVGPEAEAVREELRSNTWLHVPSIFRAEVMSGIRAMLRRNDISLLRATETLYAARSLTCVPYDFELFAERVWQLRENITVYDAWYVALAETLDRDLVTLDARLLRAPGARCRIRLPAGLKLS